MIRLYGETLGNGSFARVADGMRLGLSEHGLLAGFVPIDNYSTETFYDGADVDVAVFCGAPDRVSMMTNIGWHKRRFALLAANSTWLPKQLLESMEKHITDYIAPSTWGKEIISKSTTLPVHLWHHGVDPGFSPVESDRIELEIGYDAGRFEVAHLASTAMQRKGTLELVTAWVRAVKDNKLGKVPSLKLVVNGSSSFFMETAANEAGDDLRVLETIIWSRKRWDMSVTQAAHFYRKHHLIAQPSRGEGFGLVPLEGRASGTPVMATACTGHADHIGTDSSAVTIVPTGEPQPIDDGPNAFAPALRVDDVYEALCSAYKEWPIRVQAALRESSWLKARWSWAETTRRWLTSSGIRGLA